MGPATRPVWVSGESGTALVLLPRERVRQSTTRDLESYEIWGGPCHVWVLHLRPGRHYPHLHRDPFHQTTSSSSFLGLPFGWTWSVVPGVTEEDTGLYPCGRGLVTSGVTAHEDFTVEDPVQNTFQTRRGNEGGMTGWTKTRLESGLTVVGCSSDLVTPGGYLRLSPLFSTYVPKGHESS